MKKNYHFQLLHLIDAFLLFDCVLILTMLDTCMFGFVFFFCKYLPSEWHVKEDKDTND